MNRVRISATVDGERLEVATRLAGETGSRLLDRALAALIEQLETDRELASWPAIPMTKILTLRGGRLSDLTSPTKARSRMTFSNWRKRDAVHSMAS